MALLIRYFNTIKHLKMEQLYSRVKSIIPSKVSYPIPQYQMTSNIDECQFLAKANSYLKPSTFYFIGQTKQFENEIDWSYADYGLLWLFNLNYFDYINSNGIDTDRANLLIASWCKHGIKNHSAGMHPYTASLRIVNWIKYDLSNSELQPEQRDLLYQQCLYLYDNVEYNIMANHLIANAKALIFAGVYFSSRDSQNWLKRGLAILDKELSEQILNDGAHYERSPMYHSIILEDFIDLILILTAVSNSKDHDLGISANRREQFVNRLRKVATNMCMWLKSVTHPDGQLAFFNDCAHGIAQSPEALLEYTSKALLTDSADAKNDISKTGKSISTMESKSGLLRSIKGPFTLFTNTAPIEPKYQPSHAHADTLSFELSVRDERILVNSGTSTYAEGELRQFQRSTKAHNTVEIDGTNSSDVWKSFRVARKARIAEATSYEHSEFCTVTGTHLGYKTLLGGTLHKREWQLSESSLTITDEFPGSFRTAKLFFYLHPCITHIGDGVLHTASGNKFRWTSSATEISYKDSFWYPEFNVSIPNTCIEIMIKQDQQHTFVRNELSLVS